MTEVRRRFHVAVPDWGPEHLSTEAVAAYVDDELATAPRHRAVRHLSDCPECAAHVGAQERARSALRTAGAPCLPSSLLSALRSIPQDTELPPPPAGLAVTTDGQLVDVLRTDVESAGAPRATPPFRTSSRLRVLGATAAVSGLALGAFAFGAVPATAPAPAGPDRGVFNGSVVGGAPTEAGLRLRSGGVESSRAAAPARTGLLGP